MKNIHGKILLLSILFTLNIYANSSSLATYTLTSNKSEAVVNEAVEIRFVAKQIEHSDHMFFSLKPKKSPDYTIKLLQKIIDDKEYHNTKTTFVYVLFASKQKNIDVNFDFTIKTASDKAIKQSYVDDHDDSIAISTYDTNVPIEPLHVKIKKLKHKVDLVGDFSLTSEIDKESINQYEALNIHYNLKGKGYQNSSFNLSKNIPSDVSIFSKIQDKTFLLTKDGYVIDREFIYALTSDRDFNIPNLSIKAYSPKKDSYYTLNTQAKKIKVSKIARTNLIDSESSPYTKPFIDTQSIKQFFIYIFIFISGFITAKMSKIKLKGEKKVDALENIKKASSAKELLNILLINYDTTDIQKQIIELEKLQYTKNHTQNLKKIKQSVLDLLRNSYVKNSV